MTTQQVWRVKAHHLESKRNFDIATFDNEMDARGLVYTLDEMIGLVASDVGLECQESQYDIYIVDETNDQGESR